jgi:hypothetical protein
MAYENCDVDAELLISFIERPILWDRASETHKEKVVTQEAWRKICKIVHPVFELLEERSS